MSDKIEDTEFGFIWGPVEVSRHSAMEDSVFLDIKTDITSIAVSVGGNGSIHMDGDDVSVDAGNNEYPTIGELIKFYNENNPALKIVGTTRDGRVVSAFSHN